MPDVFVDMATRITREWMAGERSDQGSIRDAGLPRCSVCGRVLRVGSFVDPFWPFEHSRNHHLRCRRAWLKQIEREG